MAAITVHWGGVSKRLGSYAATRTFTLWALCIVSLCWYNLKVLAMTIF